MRIQHPNLAVDISLRFKPEADRVSTAEVELLVSIWPELLRAIQLEERAGQPDDDPDLE
jgi:hypothetical protein